MTRETFSLCHLQRFVAEALAEGLDDAYWVRAEIASARVSGGHCYLDLTETEEGRPLARARAVIWKFTYARLLPAFRMATGRALEAGMQVLLQVEVSYHGVYGLSLVVKDIDPSFTVGGEAARRRQTIERLQGEGLLELNKERPLPVAVRRVALISSEGAAGYGDFCRELQSNAYGYALDVRLFPALMQGVECPASVVAALDQVERESDRFDLVVIARGGGAVSDLSAFDDYGMAARAARFPLPVWSGVGHDRDVSVLDMVAHTSWKTPTAAAQAIVARNRQAEERALALRDGLAETVRAYADGEKERFERLALRLPLYLKAWTDGQRARLDALRLEVEHLSPLRVLERGYAMVYSERGLVSSASQLAPGREIEIRLADGTVKAVIS